MRNSTPHRRLAVLMLCLLASVWLLADRYTPTSRREATQPPVVTAPVSRVDERERMLERIRSHEQRADEIRRGITAMEEYIEDLVIAECRHAEGVVERDARPLRARLADFESQLPRYVKELSELEAETAELQKRIDAAARDEPELKESRARLLTRVERKSLECETLRAERDSLREAIGRLYLKPPTDLGVETVRRILQRQREELAKVERDLTEARKQLAPAPESAQKK